MNLMDMKQEERKNDIKILQVLKNNGEARFVEFYSSSDDRDRIMNAERFCDVFGYTIEELEAMQ